MTEMPSGPPDFRWAAFTFVCRLPSTAYRVLSPLRCIQSPDHRPERIAGERRGDGEDSIAAANGHGPVATGDAIALVHRRPGRARVAALRGEQLVHVGGGTFDRPDHLAR